MTELLDIPEIGGLDSRTSVVRIPPELDVPLTPRVRRLIDTPEFQRLNQISQLGLVSLVYPAAGHTRFEHSLGVYRLALLFLRRLAHDERFRRAVAAADAERFLAAALLHDLGHWPFCHPIEDMALPGTPTHELFANSFLVEGELADVLRSDWGISPRDVISLLSEKPQNSAGRILASMISGPVDIDKMDYLFRDSLHAGVPYGRNFDHQRLIGSLCLNEQGDALAITDKGKTAAEMMVFARYVMFSEVYWHHGVRSATAMLQRAFYLLRDKLRDSPIPTRDSQNPSRDALNPSRDALNPSRDREGAVECITDVAKTPLGSLFRLTERAMIAELEKAAAGTPASDLLAGLWGPRRQLYKRLAQYDFLERPALHRQLARQPYPWLVACAERFAAAASTALGRPIAPHEILIDAPPIHREIEFNVAVYYPKQDRYRPLDEVSPVVRTLARDQFDDYVKRVRLFAHPRVADDLRSLDHLDELVATAIDQTE